jgi:tetratricopeptide (TPR) repeat protein
MRCQDAVRRAVAAGRPAQARRALEQGLRLNPREPQLLEWKARLLASSGKLDKARGLLDAAAASPNAAYNVFLLRSGVRLLQGDCSGGWSDLMRAYALSPSFMFSYAEARRGPDRARSTAWMTEDVLDSAALLKAINKAVKAQPRLPEAWAWRGLIKRRMADYAGCAADLDRAQALGLKNAMTLTWRGEARLQAGDPGGMEDMTAALSLPHQAWNSAWLGRSKVAFGRDSAALKYFDEAVRLEPTNGWYRAWRAESKRLLGVRRGLLSDFDRALALDPGYDYRIWVRTWRGLACLQLGRPREALKDLNAALRLKPDYALAVVGRARANRALGRLSSWVDDLDRAARLDAKHVHAWYSRPADDVQRCIADLEDLLRRRPRDPRVLRWSGFFHLMLGRQDEALLRLRAAAGGRPPSPWAWAWLGQALQRGRDLRGARQAYSKALKLDPGSALVLSWRAAARLAVGDAVGALRDLEASVSQDKRFSAILADLGRVRLLLGRHGAATQALREATALDGKDAATWADLAHACAVCGDRPGQFQARRRAAALDPGVYKQRLKVWAATGPGSA